MKSFRAYKEQIEQMLTVNTEEKLKSVSKKITVWPDGDAVGKNGVVFRVDLYQCLTVLLSVLDQLLSTPEIVSPSMQRGGFEANIRILMTPQQYLAATKFGQCDILLYTDELWGRPINIVRTPLPHPMVVSVEPSLSGYIIEEQESDNE